MGQPKKSTTLNLFERLYIEETKPTYGIQSTDYTTIMERKLATIRKIDNVVQLSDTADLATLGGWLVVTQHAQVKAGQLAVYFEIDSWIPHQLIPFLSRGKKPNFFAGVYGERLKTIKIRGFFSQGLLMPLTILPPEHPAVEGDDVTELLGIKKWEETSDYPTVSKFTFPKQIPKTSQTRCQNLGNLRGSGNGPQVRQYQIAEKVDGSSMTVYRMKGFFGVCSRNVDIAENKDNYFWSTARREKLEAKMSEVDPKGDFAIQGELVGPGIGKNVYKLTRREFYVFDVYNIQAKEYLNPQACRELVQKMGLKHVPVLVSCADVFRNEIGHLLSFAEGTSVIKPDINREGVVFKSVTGVRSSFKAISNNYLLKD